MAFVLGATSLQHLAQVHPALVGVVQRAIQITTQDFTVFEGIRSQARQAQLVASGASKTMHSLHLQQPDGFGHAVDLVPWIDGTPRWEWPAIYPIAAAMHQAAAERNVDLVWGGVWDRRFSQYSGAVDALKHEVLAYTQRHPGPDFLDGPHYQLA